MLATPFAPTGGRLRRLLTPVVVGGLACTTADLTRRRWGSARTATSLVVVTVGTGWIERLGCRTGLPFGWYRYTTALRPAVGGVPVVVPAAWFAMALPARETAHAALGERSNPTRRILLGAVAMTAWDLFLDPQMVREGYWIWARAGRYRGIPASNFAGWLVTSIGVMAVLEVVLPPADPVVDLVTEYTAMATMEAVAFSVFFRDRVVAAVGSVAMLPMAAVALGRLVGRRA
ncbi:MAG: carotenoid biosynthesis protein [Ilumatobacteraceae bacterium]